jgi:hypothetical protein
VAAPGMTIAATVDLDERAGRVVSSDGAYVRDLSTEEAGRIRGMVDPVRFVALKSDLRDDRRSRADQYQFDIGVTFADGRHKTVTLADGEDAHNLDALSPGLGGLLTWISQESERIWNQRIKNR